MNINDLEIDENLQVRLNLLLVEFETFKKGKKINPSKEKKVEEIKIDSTTNKKEKKSLLNNFFKNFFTTEYEFQ